MSIRFGRRLFVLVVAAFTSLTLPGGLNGAPSSPFTFVHDDAGRLVAAVDPDGDTARYHYDVVGNLVSIDRVASSTTRILEVTPKKGPVGSKVTIYGTGFSATPSSNTVTFDGTAATVVEATKSRLEVTVPLLAATGTIAVTGPGGTAASATPFIVGPLAPSITSVSASVADNGDTLTITGARFRAEPTHNNVTVNGTFAEVTGATATQLTVKVPPAGAVASGPVAVETPGGRDVSAGDLFVPPLAHLAPSDVGFTGRMAVSGTATAAGATAGKHGLMVFSGQKGQRIAIRSAGSGRAYTSMVLYGPNGQPVGPEEGVSIYWGGMLDTLVLPDTGTYTIDLVPSGGTGSVDLTIYEVAADTVGEISSSGPPVTVTNTTPGQNNRLTFDGAAGQRISLRTSNLTYGGGNGAYVSIRGPDGQNLAQPAFTFGTDGGFLEPLTLPDNGTYTILVDPNQWATGSTTLRLYTVPGDATATTTLGAAATTLTTTAPGQNAVLSFSGTAGQRVTVKATGATLTEWTMRLRRPDGSTLAGPFYGSGGNPGYLEAVLAESGTYSVLVDPGWDYTGSINVRLVDATDVTGSIAVNGVETTATISASGQNAALAFTGTAGQRVSLTSSSSLSGDIDSYYQGTVEIRDASGAPIGSTTLGPPFPRDFIDAITLPASGTYTVYIDPATDRTGSVAVTLWNAADATTTATVGGSTAAIGMNQPGQNAKVAFSGSAGDRISLNTSGLAYSNALVEVTGPSGQVEVALTSVSQSPKFFEPFTLAATGTHTISIDPTGNWTGTASLDLYSVTDATATIANPGSETLTLSAPGQNGTLTFTGTTAEDLRLDVTALSIAESFLQVKKPDGSDLLGQSYLYTSGQGWNLPTLPATGTYTIALDPIGSRTGAATFDLDEQTLGGSSLQGSSTPPAAVAAGAPTGPSPENQSAVVGDTGPARVTPEVDHAKLQASLTPTARKRKAPRTRKMIPGVGRSQLLGRIRTTQGRPLAGIRVSIGRSHAVTNRNGRFRLTKLVPGRRTLLIDGTRLRRGAARYGSHEAAVIIQPTLRSDLPFTVWMQKLDRKRTMTLPKGILKKPFILRTAAIPGLQVRFPKGSKVVDRRGRQVRRMSITRIPIKRPPHPLPAGVRVPVYYSIQPALSRVVRANGKPAKARIIYPNYTYQRRGTKMAFWRYAASNGWEVFGSGRVTKNRLVVPDKGVGLSRLSGAMIGINDRNPLAGQNPDGGKDGDPVDLSTGLFGYTQTDLVLPDVLPISLTRVNNSGDGRLRAFGYGTANAYDLFLANEIPYQTANLVLPMGALIELHRISPGNGRTGAVYEHTATPGPFYKARLTYRPSVGYQGDGWDLRLRDGTTLSFAGDALRGVLQAIRDRFGNEITIVREAPQANNSVGRIKMIRSPNGRWIKPTYDNVDMITGARDNLGRTVSYTYGNGYVMDSATNPGGGTTSYTYSGSPLRVATVTDARNITFLTNTYDAAGRVASQTQADNTTYGFDYTVDGAGKVTATEVTNPRGLVRRVEFSAAGYPISDTRAHGTSDAETTTLTRQTAGNLVTRITDPLGRNTDFTYTDVGDVSSVTRLAGTSAAVTTDIAYEPTYGLLASVTDPLDHTTSYAYSGAGALESITDARGKVTGVQRDEDGQPTLITDPLGNETAIHYQAGSAVAVTDDLGNVTRAFTDAAGRSMSSSDATGRTASSTFDALNRRIASVNPAGEETTFAYDSNGNLTSLTDARDNTTGYTYDAMDRVTEREDPLGNSDTFIYDENGNLAATTDREGRLTRFAYDALDRHTFVGFDETAGSPPTYESSIDYAYDAAGRLTEADDSANGTITLTYDDLDRLTSEATPTGTVSYGYDAADRRTTMDTAGQAQTTYAYDAADRLTGITRGSQTPTFTYDDANRLTSLALPGGVAMGYSYDTADRLTRITYTNGSGELGRIDYGNDPAGRRQETSGSWARMNLPGAMATGTFDAANRLTGRGSTTHSYDDTGNLTSDGAQTYAWNARGELTGLSGGSPGASFAYDAFGRRREATIGSTTTSYRYDGDNAIVETQGLSVVRILAGLGVDSALSRKSESVDETLLADALGTTIALTDDSGAVQTEYTYDPFGTPSAFGVSSANPIQFTGREWDGTGVQFSRARYYDPTEGRFVSPDPVGFHGGDVNLYAYVGNRPMTLIDPMGQGWELPSPLDPIRKVTDPVNAGINRIRGGADWYLDRATNRFLVNLGIREESRYETTWVDWSMPSPFKWPQLPEELREPILKPIPTCLEYGTAAASTPPSIAPPWVTGAKFLGGCAAGYYQILGAP